MTLADFGGKVGWKMSVFKDFRGRQTLLSGKTLGSQRWLLKQLECHYQDEVVLQGRLEREMVPAFACKFTPDGLHGHLLAVADEDGSVRLLDTRKELSEGFISEIPCHKNAIFDISWLPGGKKLLTASGDLSVCLWDVVSRSCLDTFRAHNKSIKSVDSNKNEPNMFVSGGRDGSIYIWDTRCSSRKSGHRPVNTISNAHWLPGGGVAKKKRESSEGYSVTTVLFHGDNKIASAGSADGLVKLWDLRRNYSSCKAKCPSAWFTFDAVENSKGKLYGFSSLVSDSHQSFLFATCTDNIIYKYSSTGMIATPVEAFSGCEVSAFYVKSCVSPDNKFLLSGSSCGNGFIWELDQPQAPPLLLPGVAKEVTAVDWCPTLDKLVTCSDDNDVRVWRVKRKGGEMRRSNWGIPWSCKEYTKDGHLKAREVLQKCIDKHKSKKIEPATTRLPLKPLETLQVKAVSGKPETTPTSRKHIEEQITPINVEEEHIDVDKYMEQDEVTPEREGSLLLLGREENIKKRKLALEVESSEERKKTKTKNRRRSGSGLKNKQTPVHKSPPAKQKVTTKVQSPSGSSKQSSIFTYFKLATPSHQN